MLLLVLILVLIAFGLLVVALLSGSVLWAWVSVVVSIAAAGVLLADWQQRRSAVRAGAESGEQEPEPGAARPRYVDAEPATEVIPVVGGAAATHGGAATSIFHRDDMQDTVVMSAVQPSGSPDLPSGAEDSTTSSSGGSSPWVTDSASEDRPDGSGDPDATSPDTAGEPADEPDADAGAPAAGASGAVAATDDTGTLFARPADTTGPGGTAGHGSGGSTAAGGSGGSTAAGGSTGSTAASDPEATTAVTAAGSGAVEGTAELPATGAAEADPPEETRDATTAAIVAGLQDEVVVVDEKPRYHVSTCRSLLGRPIIPLPAAEAVDLGFTPCGWCRPDHTLSSRHRAGVR